MVVQKKKKKKKKVCPHVEDALERATANVTRSPSRPPTFEKKVQLRHF
jgi:hypothetical protein